MQRMAWSSEGVPEREQFERWRELVARQFWHIRFERDGPATAPYRGTMVVQSLGEARLVDMRCEGGRSVRDRVAAARVSEDVLMVQQESAAAARYEAGYASFACQSGDLAIHPPDVASVEEGPRGWAQRVWVIPRRRLLPLLPAAGGPYLHIPYRDGAAALAAGVAQLLAGQAERLEPAAADAALDAFCRLLAVAAGAGPGAVEGGREALRAAALERVRQYVDRHLADFDLPPERVAKAVGLSLRQLHRVFEPTGETFARHVTRRRLETCRAALTGSGRPLADIAFAAGFDSLSTFNRTFRRTFGAAPSELRAAAAQRP